MTRARGVLAGLISAVCAAIVLPGALATTDRRPTRPALSVRDVVVREGDSGTTAANFVVRLSRATPKPVRVRFRTAQRPGDNARRGDDYRSSSGTLTFRPRQTTKRIVVRVVGDTQAEDEETFSLVLDRPRNARIARARAVATIRANDLPPPFTVRAAMDGSQELPPRDPRYRGTAVVRLDPAAGQISYTLTAEGLPRDSTVAHIHRGGRGEQGTDVASLSPAPPANGSASGQMPVERRVILEIHDDPSRFYVQVHDVGPNYEAFMRGQLARA